MFDVIAVVLVVIVVWNIYGDKFKEWVKSNMSPKTAETVKAVTNVVVDDVTKIHSAVDNWLALRKLPNVMSDPEMVAALDKLRNAILTWTPDNKESK